MWIALVILMAIRFACAPASAVELAGIFSQGMVLQRDATVPLWGNEAAGENVTVEFAGQKKSATAGADGKWSVKLAPMPASATPRTLTVRGANTLTVDDVLVGEVWLASGQSNMGWGFAPGQGVLDNEKEMTTANDPLVRQFTLSKATQNGAKIIGAWHTATRENLLAGGNTTDSAIAYFFARDLKKELDVPVGVINASIGSTTIESWLPGTGPYYDAMIQPLAPYAMRGFLWYQGEQNMAAGDAANYTVKMRKLVSGWRKLWGNDNLSFYYVQIAPHVYSVPFGLSPEALPFFWEAQAKVLEPEETKPNGTQPAQAAPRTMKEWEQQCAQVLEGMQQVMGPLPGDDRKVPLDIKVEAEEVLPRYVRKKISFAAEKGDRVPAYLLIPRNLKTKVPAVLCLHQTIKAGKAEPVGLARSPDLAYAAELAERGYVTLAPDYPYFGENTTIPYFLTPAYASATMKGIWNHMRAVDLLQSLPEVDGARIGCIGHSLGGHNTLFLSAFDPRIKAMVSNSGFTSFAKFAEFHAGNLDAWSGISYMPRVRTVYGNDPGKMPFDFNQILASLAPRALLVIAPKQDPNFDVAGVRESVAYASASYALMAVAEKLSALYPEGGHTFPEEMRQAAYSWLDRWLKETSAEVNQPINAAPANTAGHVGMAVITDLVDDVNNVHPSNKQDVAHRLVLLALAHDYGKKVEYSGPVYKGKEVRGGKIILSFDHAAGLVSKDGKRLTHFTIAGADQKFVPAEAVIEGHKVVVSSPQIAEPIAVRFAWYETAMPNLTNKASLPAAPFRTDDWPMPANALKPKS